MTFFFFNLDMLLQKESIFNKNNMVTGADDEI